MNKVKVFAMYLPQYHETEENNKFWGEGFTDWISVKKATQLFNGHLQPKTPLNNNYYDLSKVDCIKWQAELAIRYGIDAWGIYHYWFNSKQQTLTKPAELILANKNIEIPFFFAWDNTSWKRTWSKLSGNDWAPLNDENKLESHLEPEILIEYNLGKRSDWEIHFNYLMPYFKDDRYVKHDGKPLFIIFRYSQEIMDMAKYWDELARKEGLNGIEFVFSYNPFHGIPYGVHKFYYEPLYSGWGNLWLRLNRFVFKNKQQKEIQIFDYEKIWKKIIFNARRCRDENAYYGAFVGYDDSPRRGNKGKAVVNASPEVFAKYLKQLIAICEEQGKQFIFLTAWNEWGEGAYLEPDVTNGYSYLEKLKEIRDKA